MSFKAFAAIGTIAGVAVIAGLTFLLFGDALVGWLQRRAAIRSTFGPGRKLRPGPGSARPKD